MKKHLHAELLRLFKRIKFASLWKGSKIIALAVDFTENQAKQRLVKIAEFHGLTGDVFSHKEKGEEIKEFVITSLLSRPTKIDFSLYRYPEIYAKVYAIPCGKTLSYGEIAKLCRGSARKVAAAMRFNPLPFIIPCHRVVGKRSIGGYTPLGKEFKKRLIEIEKHYSIL